MGYVDTINNANKYQDMLNNSAQENAAKAKALDSIVAQQQQMDADKALATKLDAVATASMQKGADIGYNKGLEHGGLSMLNSVFAATSKGGNGQPPFTTTGGIRG